MSQRWALRQHSCNPFCPDCSHGIDAKVEVSQRWALCQHPCKALFPACSNVIATEIKVRQRWALSQQSCKPLCILSFHCTLRQRECDDVQPAFIAASCLQTNSSFVSVVPLRASSQRLLFQRTTEGGHILSTASLTLFDVLLSMIVLQAAQVLHQSSAGTASRAAAKASVAITLSASVFPFPRACLAAGSSVARTSRLIRVLDLFTFLICEQDLSSQFLTCSIEPVCDLNLRK